MRIKIVSIGTIAAVAAVLLFTACKRDKIKDTDSTEDTQYADDQARMDQTFDDAGNMADDAAEMGNVALKGAVPLSGCATVTRDTVSIPHTITIDFGTTNCSCLDGRTRRGQIIVSYNGKYKDSGYIHTISFNNYYVNDNHVLGTKTVQNMGHNSGGHSYYNITINGMMIMSTTGDTASHTSNRVRTWVNGENTSLRSDDVYSITGSGSLTRRNGKTFAMSITSPLIVAVNCRWIKQGTISITPAGATKARTLDFGSGNCDDQATITVGTHSKTITLK